MDRPGVVDGERDPRYEPVDAPDAPSFPVPDPYAEGERGYEPIKPRSGLGDLAAEARRADRRARVPDRQVRRVHPQVQGRDDGALDARLRRGLRVALGASVRDRLRAPDPRPRARTRLRAAPPGSPHDRAALHPVPRRGDRDEGASRRRLEGGAGGARRPDPRIGRCGGLLDRGGGDRLGDAHGPRVRRVLPEPLQPHPDRAARRRTRCRRAASRALVRRVC